LNRFPASVQVIFRAVVHWWDDWFGLAGISLVWTLCWATVVLGPPATFAIYAMESRYIRGDRPALREMVALGRRYFVKSWLWMLANLLVILGLVSNWQFYSRFEGSWVGLVQFLTLVLSGLWLLTQWYAVPYFVIQEKSSLRLAWRNGLFTVLAAPGYTLVLVLFAAVVGLVSTVAIAPLVLGGLAFIAILGCQAVQERVEVYRALAQK
jgi:uncharacterized membrane protein YesL